MSVSHLYLTIKQENGGHKRSYCNCKEKAEINNALTFQSIMQYITFLILSYT